MNEIEITWNGRPEDKSLKPQVLNIQVSGPGLCKRDQSAEIQEERWQMIWKKYIQAPIERNGCLTLQIYHWEKNMDFTIENAQENERFPLLWGWSLLAGGFWWRAPDCCSSTELPRWFVHAWWWNLWWLSKRQYDQNNNVITTTMWRNFDQNDDATNMQLWSLGW